MARPIKRFVCQSCGAVTNKWSGRCESCGEWNTIVEEAGQESAPRSGSDDGLNRNHQAFCENLAGLGIGIVGYARLFVDGASNAVSAQVANHGEAAAPHFAFAKGAKTQSAFYSGVGNELTHYEVDFAGAELARRDQAGDRDRSDARGGRLYCFRRRHVR